MVKINLNSLSAKTYAILMFFVALVFLYFIYSPVFHIPFAYNDQYTYLAANKSSYLNYPEYNLLRYYLGRPVALIFECFNYLHTHGLSNINNLRLISLLFMVFAVMLLSYLAQRSGLKDRAQSFIFALLVFTMPAAVNFIVMSNTADIFSIILAFVAQMVLLKTFKEDFSAKSRLFSLQSLSLLIVVLLLVLSFMTYQVGAVFFVLPVMLRILFIDLSEWKKTRSYLVISLLLLGISALIYYIIAKAFIVMPGYAAPDGYNMKLTLDLAAKISLLFDKYIPMSANLWNIYPKQIITLAVIALILVAGLIKTICFIKQNQNKRYLVEAFIGILAVLLAGNFVFFVAPIGNVLYRFSYCWMALIFSLLLSALFFYIKIFLKKKPEQSKLVLMLFLLIMGSVMANQAITKVALYANMEFNYYSTKVHQLTKKRIVKLYVQLPTKAQMPGRFKEVYTVGEFNRFSSYFSNVPVFLVPFVLREQGFKHYFFLRCLDKKSRLSKQVRALCYGPGKEVNLASSQYKGAAFFYRGKQLSVSDAQKYDMVINPGFLKRLTD